MTKSIIMAFKSLIILSLFCALTSFSTNPPTYKLNTADDWVIKKDEEEIKVSIRKYKNSNLLEFKAEAEISSSLSCLISVIRDIDDATSLFAASKEAKILEKINEREWVVWSYIDVPFPFDDRDMIARMRLRQEIESKIVTIKINGEPEFIPKKNNKVRIPLVDGSITYIPLGKNRTKIIYQNVTDPGGLIPNWLMNMGVVKAPFETLQNYRILSGKEKHQNAHFDFIED